ncbi:MAG: PQQ-binding-like beta-propeller repeat protein [Elusimicrobia bacterium]|nr:PQQ-binding-like beta-propeller repeat protein [Elusimicrobiota bacterium]
MTTLCVTSITFLHAEGPANSPWPIFRHDPQHTSSTTFGGPMVPRLKWKVYLRENGEDPNLVHVRNGRGVSIDGNGNVIAAMGNAVVALQPADGAVIWASSSTSFGINPSTTALIGRNYTQPLITDTGKIFVSSGDAASAIFALTTNRGSLVEGSATVLKTGGSAGETASLARALNISTGSPAVLLASGGDGALGDESVTFFHAVVSTGGYKWKSSFGGATAKKVNDVVISTDNNRAYFAQSENSVVSSGSVSAGVFSNFSASLEPYAMIVGPDGTIYASKKGGSACGGNSCFAAINPADGTAIWTALSSATVSDLTMPIALSGTRLFGAHSVAANQGGYVYAFNTADGQKLWEFNVQSAMGNNQVLQVDAMGTATKHGNPRALTISQGTTLYFMAAGHEGTSEVPPVERRLFALNALTGGLLWSIPLEQSPTLEDDGTGNANTGRMGQVVTGGSGQIYLQSRHLIYAFEESGVTSFSVARSTSNLTPNGSVLLTVQVSPSSSSIPVEISLSSRPKLGASSVELIGVDPPSFFQMTNSVGIATFSFKLADSEETTLFNDLTATVTVNIPGLVAQSTGIFVETNAVDHYGFSVPTQVAVGVSFNMQVFARNKYDHTTTRGENINLLPIQSGSSDVGGTGNLFTNSLTVPNGGVNAGSGTVTNQNYNRVENIQIKAVGQTSNATGYSSVIDIVGPAAFQIDVASSVSAGSLFVTTITAIDGSAQRVWGYSATVGLSSLNAASTNTAGGGILGVTNANLSGGQVVISNQSYTKVENIRIKVQDTALNVSSLSSTVTVRSGSASSIVLTANPASIIQGQTAQLTAALQDSFSNNVEGTTVTFAVAKGSGTLSQTIAGLAAGHTSTTSVTGSNGQATVFFGLPAGLTEAQTNVASAAVNSLQAATTVFVSILVTSGGGVIVQSEDPRTKVTLPANAYGFNVQINLKSKDALDAAKKSKTDAALAKGIGLFIQNFAKEVLALRQSDSQEAGQSSELVTLEFPFDTDGASNVTVSALGSYGPSVLIPASALRVFKLNETSSVFEEVMEGNFNVADVSGKVVKAKVKLPSGVYSLGVPPYVSAPSTATTVLTSQMTSGATVQVTILPGTFGADVVMETTLPNGLSIPAASGASNRRAPAGAGLYVDVRNREGLQPSGQVKIVVSYRAGDVTGLTQSNLKLARYDLASSQWTLLESQVDTLAKKVTGYTGHLSLFGVFEVTPLADLSAAKVYPNPFQPARGHGVITFAAPVDTKISIFTVSGRLVKKLETGSSGTATWDARDIEGNQAASGVYLALLEGKEKKTLKVAIER